MDTLSADTQHLSASAAPQPLYERYVELRIERGWRARAAASRLGVTEAEAVASALGREGRLAAVRLAPPWPALFEQLPALGEAMALTRNESAVHEKVGVYEAMSHDGQVGLALGKAIDLRIFYAHWAHAYAVAEEHSEPGQPVRHSLQVFDAYGDAVHKTLLRPRSDRAAWRRFVERNADARQQPGVDLLVRPARTAPAPDETEQATIDALRNAWAALRDTHQFSGLLRRFGLARTRALRLAGREFAAPLAPRAVRALLARAAATAQPIMCFVGNAGMIQIHTGPVFRVESTGPWINVLDADFNLHLREADIAELWLVRKPTDDGIVTSVEAFDAAGRTIAMFFGERKPGLAERADWRQLSETLPAGDAA
jgi:putative hemin transport protein